MKDAIGLPSNMPILLRHQLIQSCLSLYNLTFCKWHIMPAMFIYWNHTNSAFRAQRAYNANVTHGCGVRLERESSIFKEDE